MAKARYAGSAQGIGAPGERCVAEILAAAVAELEQLDAGTLRRRWRTLVGGGITPDLGRPLILRLLAYKLQAQHLGDIDKASLGELSDLYAGHKGRVGSGASADPLVSAVDKGRHMPTAPAVVQPKSLAPRIARPGTLLTREHGGVLHRVMVLDDGVSWNGKTYDSLSKVALAITGTNWNGPRFFGLRYTPTSYKDDRLSAATAKTVAVIGRGRAVRRPPRVSP